MTKKIASNAYFANIQALRAVAALLVLLFHTYIVEGKYFGAHLVPKWLGLYGSSGVDLFFVISGFVMVTVTRGQFGSSLSAVDFLKRRVLRIYPIYWFYSAIVLAVMFVMPQWVNSSTGHHAYIVSSLLLWPSGTLPLLQQGWTLIYEMFFYLVFALMIAWVSERFLAPALAIWAGVTGALAYWLGSYVSSHPVLGTVANPLVFEFIAGCFVAMIWPAMHGWRAVIALVGAASSIVALFVVGRHVEPDTIIQWRALYFGVPAFLLVLGAVSLERKTGRIAPRGLLLLGDASYSLYLSHVLVISAVGRLFSRVASAHSPVLGTLMCLGAAVVCGVLGFRLIEQPLNAQIKHRFRPAFTS